MKKKLMTFLVAVFTLCFVQYTNAQEITEVQMPMSQGTNNALMVNLPKTDAKTVAKAWEKYIKDFDGKTKKNKKTKEIFTDNALIEAMSSNTIDVYTVVKEQKGGSQLVVWFDLGGAYLASATHPEHYEVAQKMLNKFSTKISVGLAEEVYEAAKDVLEKEEDKLSKLDKNEADLKKSIKDYQKKIKELEEEIAKNAEARKAQAQAVEAERTKTEKAKKALEDIK